MGRLKFAARNSREAERRAYVSPIAEMGVIQARAWRERSRARGV